MADRLIPLRKANIRTNIDKLDQKDENDVHQHFLNFFKDFKFLED
jgi:hypothetical protein